MHTSAPLPAAIESPIAWLRVLTALVLGAIVGVAMWSVPVVLPAVQADFGVARADASLPYTLAMLGYAVGGVLMGRLSDRFGILLPIAVGACALSVGYIAAGFVPNLALFALLYGVIGLGASAAFGPLIADVSQWFTRRRGIAIAIVSCGQYVAGTIWPPVLQHLVATQGWRATHIGLGVFCALTMLPLLFATQALSGGLLILGLYVPLALTLLAPVIVNIFAFHAFLAPSGLALASVLVVLEVSLAWVHRSAYRPLFAARPAAARAR